MVNHEGQPTYDELREALAQSEVACQQLEAAAGLYAGIFDRHMPALARACGLIPTADPEQVLIRAVERLRAERVAAEFVEAASQAAEDWKEDAGTWKGACMQLAEAIAANRRLEHLIPLGVEVSVVDLGKRAIGRLSTDLDNAEAEAKDLRARLASEQEAHAGTYARLQALKAAGVEGLHVAADHVADAKLALSAVEQHVAGVVAALAETAGRKSPES